MERQQVSAQPSTLGDSHGGIHRYNAFVRFYQVSVGKNVVVTTNVLMHNGRTLCLDFVNAQREQRTGDD